MKIYFKFSLIWLLSQVNCWKPIDHPAAYTVHQSFSDGEPSAVSRSSSSNFISSGDSVDTLLDSFNKNGFSDDVSGTRG
jgi:hypothetical protein